MAIAGSIEWGEDFQDIDGILEKDLVACKARDTADESHMSYRKFLHQYKWMDLETGQALIHQIQK